MSISHDITIVPHPMHDAMSDKTVQYYTAFANAALYWDSTQYRMIK